MNEAHFLVDSDRGRQLRIRYKHGAPGPAAPGEGQAGADQLTADAAALGLRSDGQFDDFEDAIVVRDDRAGAGEAAVDLGDEDGAARGDDFSGGIGEKAIVNRLADPEAVEPGAVQVGDGAGVAGLERTNQDAGGPHGAGR